MTKAQIETLAVMQHGTAYSSASAAQRRREVYKRAIYVNVQRKVFERMLEDGLVVKVKDYSGDMWERVK